MSGEMVLQGTPLLEVQLRISDPVESSDAEQCEEHRIMYRIATTLKKKMLVAKLLMTDHVRVCYGNNDTVIMQSYRDPYCVSI